MTMQVQTATPVDPTTSAAGYGDMGDIAFALAAYQMEALDGDIGDRLENLKKLTALKSAYREKIYQLRELLKDLDDPDDVVKLDGDSMNKASFSVDPGTGEVVDTGTEPLGSGLYKVLLNVGGLPDDPTAQPIYAEFAFTSYEDAMDVVEENPGSKLEVYADREDVENEIARLQGQMDALSGEGEMGLLAINRLLSKRNQALQLASNILGSQHQTAMGIISNIK